MIVEFLTQRDRRSLQNNGGQIDSNQHQTTNGMLTTLLTSVIVFLVIQSIFEYNRYYKHIYLKRLQRRFQVLFHYLSFETNPYFIYTVNRTSSKRAANAYIGMADRNYAMGRAGRVANGWARCLHATSVSHNLLQVSKSVDTSKIN